jgi:hypothetical protein
MEIPVLIEPFGDDAFRATCGAPWNLETTAPTRDQAVEMLREQIDDRLEAGAEVIELKLGDRPHPLAKFAGIFKDDPLLEDWKQAMAEYRQAVEERLQKE